jgi:hypothetical protein
MNPIYAVDVQVYIGMPHIHESNLCMCVIHVCPQTAVYMQVYLCETYVDLLHSSIRCVYVCRCIYVDLLCCRIRHIDTLILLYTHRHIHLYYYIHIDIHIDTPAAAAAAAAAAASLHTLECVCEGTHI